MSRTAIGTIALVLLASLPCEPQETKASPLTRLRQISIVVEDLHADAKTVGLSVKSLESQMLVGLRRDIPKLVIRENTFPYLYLNVSVGQHSGSGGQESGFSAYVMLILLRPVMILEDVGAGQITFTTATVWWKIALLAGSRTSIHRLVKDEINEKLTEFAADYYRQNPP